VDRPPPWTTDKVSLVFDAELRVDDPLGRSMTVTMRDGRGTIVVPRAALRYSAVRTLTRNRARWGAGIQRLLDALGLTIEVTCEGRTIAIISGASSGNWLARLLRLGPVDVRLLGVLAALALPAPEAGRG
jgi:hypothetical protein